MDVAGHHFQRHDPPPPFLSLGPDQPLQTFYDPAVEDRPAVLRAPHHMQPEVVHPAGEPANPPDNSDTNNIQTSSVYEACNS
ncbi:hypothetical protein GCM10023191_093660 [Actinoallomurus oryzae]|uniref:Uncharacterized protein n=1 Tax=Actinoallomurus oryzae TaxID=502180 RepID=A0ABP8R5M7_9ACTN